MDRISGGVHVHGHGGSVGHATTPTNRRPTICERGTSLYYSYVEGYVVDLVNLPNLRVWLLNEYSANQQVLYIHGKFINRATNPMRE